MLESEDHLHQTPGLCRLGISRRTLRRVQGEILEAGSKGCPENSIQGLNTWQGRPPLRLKMDKDSPPLRFTPVEPAREVSALRVSVPTRVRTLSRKYCDSLSDPLVEFHSRSVTHSGWVFGVKLRLRLGGEIFFLHFVTSGRPHA